MFNTARCAILAVFAILLLAAPAAAQTSADIFTVARVPVDASAASAEEARLIAQDRGRSQAMRILLQRLTPSEDWAYLPRPDLNELLNMQVGFEVEEERFSTQATDNRYLARITYAFRPDMVRALLRAEHIAFSETQAAPALVLPVFTHGGSTILWEEENPWAAAWYDFNLSHELVPLSMPLGDLGDSTSAPLEAVQAGNWEVLGPLAERYGASRVFIAHAVLEGEPGTGTLFVRMTEISENGVGQVVETRTAGANNTEAPLGGLGIDAIQILSGRLSDRWKAQTLVSYDVQRRIDATAWFATLAEWRTINNALSDLPTVTEYNTYAMSSMGAEVSVTFVGSPEQLQITLGQRGVVLRGEGGRWALRSRTTASAMTEFGGAQPPVETVAADRAVRPAGDEPPTAQTLTDDDLGSIFEEPLTEEEVEDRRSRGLGDRPGTMQPVGN